MQRQESFSEESLAEGYASPAEADLHDEEPEECSPEHSHHTCKDVACQVGWADAESESDASADCDDGASPAAASTTAGTGCGESPSSVGDDCSPGSSSGRPAGQGSPTAPWWRIVWCHERCHKREHEVRRKAIDEATREAGGLMVCRKKASQFDAWLAHAQRPPYVLLTDWREAKPCLGAVAQRHRNNRPMLTMVLCEGRRQCARARTWVQSLPGPDVVHVCVDLGSPRAFVRDVLKRFHGVEVLPPATAKPPGDGQGLACPRPLPLPHKAAEQRREAPAEHAGPGPQEPAGCVPQHLIPAAAGAPPFVTIMRAYQVMTPVAGLMAFNSPAHGMQAFGSPAQLERLLRDAMPDHYDD